MADVPVGAVSAPAPAVTATVVPTQPAPSARAAKLAAANAGLAKIQAAAKKSAVDEPAQVAPDAAPAPAGDEPKPKAPAVADKTPVEAKPEPKAEEPDPVAARGIAAIDKQAAKFRAEQAKARADHEADRAALALDRADFARKSTAFEELQALARKNPVALLERLGLKSEDDFEVAGRAILPYTKTGKNAPGAKEQAEKALRERGVDSTTAELREKIEQLENEFKTRDQTAQAQAFVDRYLDAAVKAIPATPTLIGKLHTKSPDKARQALLHLGARMEKDNDGEAPAHAEVIAEYERIRRAELEEQGVDVDALLKPPAPVTPAKTPSRTLDITASGSTPAINGRPTRADRLAAFNAEQRRRTAAT